MLEMDIFKQKPLNGPRFLGKLLGAMLGFVIAFGIIVAIEWTKAYLF